MLKNSVSYLVLLLAVVFLVSCSGGHSNVLSPSADDASRMPDAAGFTVCLGLWQAVADKGSGTLEFTPARSSEYILNVLGFLEPPALVNLQIDNLFIDFGNSELLVDVILRHPLPDPIFKGFDVRGVVFGPRLVNADGLTPVMAPKYFEGVPFGYINGLLGTPNSLAGYDEDIFGYKYFCDGLGANDDLAGFFSQPSNLDSRGVFSNSAVNRRHYHLRWAGTGYAMLVFNYAVYANFDWPVGGPPIEIDDFPISTANSQEAFCGNITEISNTLFYSDTGGGGGSISLQAEIWDWQGNIDNVTIKSADGVVISETPGVLVGDGSTEYSYIYSFTDIPATPTTVGNLDIIITAYDENTFGESWFLGLLPPGNPTHDDPVYNCFRHIALVADCPPPVITEIIPAEAWSGVEVEATIKGTFIDGPELAAKLMMAGQDDIIAQDVVYDGVTGDITCTLDLTDAAGGDWTVVVINGCGTPGSLPDGFTINSCEGQKECPSGYFSVDNHLQYFIHYPFYGTDATRSSSTQYLICCGYKNDIRHCIFAYQPGSGTYAYRSEKMGADDNSGGMPRCLACDSSDRIYYRIGSDPTHLMYIDFYGDGFGPIDQPFGVPVPWGSIYRVTLDENDNPIVLCYSGITFRIYTWNGTDWGTPITVSGTVIAENGNSYSNINDFEYNPVTGDYMITSFYDPPKFYAIDSGGNVIFSNTDLWNTAGSGHKIYAGIFIDRDNPECRFIIQGAPEPEMTSQFVGPAHFARCNPGYGEWTFSTTEEGQRPFFDGLGSVVNVNGVYYFCGTSSYRWHSTYIQVPEW